MAPTTATTTKKKTLLTDHVNRDLDAAKAFDYANHPIPNIDESCFSLHSLAPFITPEKFQDADREQLLRDLQKSCETVGFFLIKDHGIDSQLIHQAHAVSQKFFLEATPEEKQALSGQYYLGYTCSENVSAYQGRGGKLPEPVEKFSVFAEGPDRNVWPTTTAGADEYKETITRYYEACHRLGLLLEHLTEQIMGVPKGTLRQCMVDTMKSGSLRLHLYHSQDSVKEVLGGHTDLSTITLVSATQPGYEVLVDGAWQPVPHMAPDVFVVNLGDLYKAWSNGQLVSAIHRVNSASTGTRRSSINFFATTVAEFDNEPPIILETLPPYVGKGIEYTPLNLRHEIKRRFGLLKVEEEEEAKE